MIRCLLLVLVATALIAAAPPGGGPFAITVVDEQTGRGVPLVELTTVHGVRLVTDSAGVAVFDEPGLEGHTVYFQVKSHGYAFRKDGFGFPGRALAVERGNSARLTIRRVQIAERLYRVTGAGIYRDSVLAGKRVPIREPVLNGQVLGCDSVLNAVYRDKLYWFYGDTNRPGYPLGNFHVSGAQSDLPGKGGLEPGVGVNLRWFIDSKGFAKPMATMPGTGPTWITSLVVLSDKGRERLLASYVKVKPPLQVYGRGLAIFDDDKQAFTHLDDFPMQAPAWPAGHSFLHREGDSTFIYFCHPYPLTRVRATLSDWRKPECYESYTCLKHGSRLDRAEIDRDGAGRVRYAWRKDTPAVGPAEQEKLIRAGKLRREEAQLALRDRDSGKAVLAHSGSVYWNAHRRRWVMIAVQLYGTSVLGEVWYAEADTPTGPWAYAVKVATHERYSFYNPKQHPMFDREGGRVIHFEGTYTHTFSGNPERTPRYDYNQVMYRLDLGDERLALPVAVVEGGQPRYFALDRRIPKVVAFTTAGKTWYGLPADARSETTVPLYEHVRGDQVNLSPAEKVEGYRRKEPPVCRVWPSPWTK